MAGRRGAALITALITGIASPAPARAFERSDGLDIWPSRIDLQRVPSFRLPDLALYPPTATFGVILAALAGTGRIVRAGTGKLARVHVIEQDGLRTEYQVSDEGKILSVRVRPSLFSPL